MNLLNNYQYISSLILKEKLDGLTPAEAAELQKWLAGDPRHRELYERLKRKNLVLNLARYNEIDTEKGLMEYRRRYVRHPVRYLWISVAAVMVLFVGIASLFLSVGEEGTETVKGIVPGRSKAELVLSDGSVWTLEPVAGEKRLLAINTVACNSGTRLRYRHLSDTSVLSAELPVYNELRVPVGGEFQVVLSDGTVVWLNSQSRLKYPVVFTDSIREVELIGEAYFEVASNKKSPFRVQLREQVRVEVLGTSFNVRDYPDEELLETVLEEGRVRLIKGNCSVSLTPGMKGVYATNSGNMSTKTVDTELYTSWRNGHFIFQNERLETILHKLSRWYEIQVFFGDEDARGLLFSGNVKKYENIEKLFEAIRMAGGARFEIQGNCVTVYSENK
ncbi:MAG: FecR domain-containing protein [Odoribacter sp.]|nr:FecR domain-containing protein [Odoribacter sp.]